MNNHWKELVQKKSWLLLSSPQNLKNHEIAKVETNYCYQQNAFGLMLNPTFRLIQFDILTYIQFNINV